MKLINENGKAKDYGTNIPDLWHIAMQLEKAGKKQSSERVLKVWHMAHDLRAVINGTGEAQLIEKD